MWEIRKNGRFVRGGYSDPMKAGMALSKIVDQVRKLNPKAKIVDRGGEKDEAYITIDMGGGHQEKWEIVSAQC